MLNSYGSFPNINNKILIVHTPNKKIDIVAVRHYERYEVIH